MLLHFLAIFVVMAVVMAADTVEAKCEKRALNEGETAFYAGAAEAVQVAFSAPEEWRRRLMLQKTPKTRRLCEGKEQKPLQFHGQIKFKEITESDRIREEMALRQKALDDKILDATSRGDLAEMQRLRPEMDRIIEENRVSLKKLEELHGTEPKADEMLLKIKINETRRVIGKKFEIEALDGTKMSFERINSEGTERESVTKMLYIGDWEVTDFKKNWSLLRPEVPNDRIGGVRVHITGKRAIVEAYLSGKANLGAFSKAN